MKRIILFFCLCFQFSAFAQSLSISGQINIPPKSQVGEIEVLLVEKDELKILDNKTTFRFDSLQKGSYTFRVFAPGYYTQSLTLELKSDSLIQIDLKPFSSALNTVEIKEDLDNDFGMVRLKPVEGTAVYAGKKSEVLILDDLTLNKATNNSRQLYSKVAGLSIWESDDAGIQLGIGGRGLNPNRVSNFNTRQNGYDISADALGYPESYYSPSAESIERIEIVRGAASLQYGTQFGGFINFKLKEGPADSVPLALTARQTLGSYNFYNSFTSLGANYKKWKFYGFFQYKKGDSWRPNAGYEVVNLHQHWQYSFNRKSNIHLEYTHMNYLAQQAGGLTDRMFQEDPQQSIRERNWFQVNWNLAAIQFNHRFSSQTEFNSRAFGLLASRFALGNLGQITRIDFPDTDRNLLKDEYKNYGIENRLIHRYQFLKNTSIFLVGMRYYNGFTERKQGRGSRGSDANFTLRDENKPEDSFYDFPSQNLAFFSENVFYLSPKITLTPGVRFEYINTESEGYYVNRSSNLAGQIISEESIEDNRQNERSFILAGLGFSYKPNPLFELYTNISQNYRSINFNDVRIVNANYQVDPNLKDESGYSADFGIRGNKARLINYDLSLFYLNYSNRIGEVRIVDPVLFRPIRYRTNVADSRTIGLESFAEINLIHLFSPRIKDHSFRVFGNFSWMNAEYINSKETAYEGNDVELVPQIIFKSGISYSYKSFQISGLYSFTDEHYTDATNAEFTSNAVDGLIPAYSVIDLSLAYSKKHWLVETGINNLEDKRYFTRRASGYPGPGIIPANPRTWYLTLGLKF